MTGPNLKFIKFLISFQGRLRRMNCVGNLLDQYFIAQKFRKAEGQYIKGRVDNENTEGNEK